MAHSHGYIPPHFDPNFAPSANPVLPFNTNDPAHYPQTAPVPYGSNTGNVYDQNIPTNVYDPTSIPANVYDPTSIPANVYDPTSVPAHPNPYVSANTYGGASPYNPSGIPTYDTSVDPNMHAPYDPNNTGAYPSGSQSYAPGPSTNVHSSGPSTNAIIQSCVYGPDPEHTAHYFETHYKEPSPPQREDYEMSTSDKGNSPGKVPMPALDKDGAKPLSQLDILVDIRAAITRQGDKIDASNLQAKMGFQQAKKDAKDMKEGLKELKKEVVGLGDKVVGLGDRIMKFSERVTTALESNASLLNIMSECLIRVKNNSTQLVVNTCSTKQQVEKFSTQVDNFTNNQVPLPFNTRKLIEAIAEAAASSVAEATARSVTATLHRMTLDAAYSQRQVSSSAQIKEVGEDKVDGYANVKDAEDEDEDEDKDMGKGKGKAKARPKGKGRAEVKVKIEEEDGDEGEEEEDSA